VGERVAIIDTPASSHLEVADSAEFDFRNAGAGTFVLNSQPASRPTYRPYTLNLILG
jgi:hypothetical protein